MDGKLRMMTALYLTNGERILLLYRIGSKIADHSYIGCAGGHFESHEYNDARACVLRELYEETGLSEDALENLTLRYVTLRLKNGEIRENYYFFAALKNPAQQLSSSEGTLRWVSLQEIDDLPMPVSAAYMLRHYRAQGRYDTHLYGGITEADGIRFAPMTEF
ncbi:MAG: NUDIX domain-containing protein [Clostridia bacterium]|nr:NUDIX domain-containing protein [Clostridia bacterium]